MHKNDAGLYETEIDGHKYEFEKWGAEDSYDTLLDIAKICGKPLGLAVGSLGPMFKADELDKQFDPNVLGTIMESLTQGIGDKVVTKAITKKLVVEKCLCDGQKFAFNTHYQDRLDHMFKVLWAALEVQYGNFFSALLGLVSSRQAMFRGLTNRVPQT